MLTNIFILIQKGWKSKTVWFGFLLTMIGAFQSWIPAVQSWMSPEAYSIVTTVVGFIVIVLRVITHKPLIEK